MLKYFEARSFHLTQNNMKNKIVPLLLLFCIGCSSKEDKIQKTWICKYAESYYTVDSTRITPLSPTIFSFDKDSVNAVNLPIYGNGYREQKISYKIEADTLLFSHKKGIEKAQINSISADSLILSFSVFSNNDISTNKKQYNVVYEQLPNYHLAKRQAELFEELTTSVYKVEDDTLEFNEKGLYIVNESFQVHRLWSLMQYDNELFIVNVGYSTPPIHIKDFNRKEITGIMYGRENRVIEYTKIPVQEKFDLSNLAGKWERFYEGGEPPLPPEYPEATKKIYEQETLHISGTTMLSYHFYKRDTVDIETNKLKTHIVFYDKRENLHEWEIQELTKDKLTVKKDRLSMLLGGQIATFKRIE